MPDTGIFAWELFRSNVGGGASDPVYQTQDAFLEFLAFAHTPFPV